MSLPRVDRSRLERAQVEREKARRERELAARELHLAFLYGGPLEASTARRLSTIVNPPTATSSWQNGSSARA